MALALQVRVTEAEFDLACRYLSVWRLLTLADRVPRPYLFAVTRSMRGVEAAAGGAGAGVAGPASEEAEQFRIEWKDLHASSSSSSLPSSSAAAAGTMMIR